MGVTDDRVRDAAHQSSLDPASAPTAHSNEANLELFGEIHDLLGGIPHPEVAFCYRAPHVLDVLYLFVMDPPCLLLHPSRFDVQRS